MQALLYLAHGDLDRVRIGTVPQPAPGPGQVLVRTRAAALNHLDLWVLKGLPGLKLEMPHIPGSDAAGVVHSVGSGVTRFTPGDPVMLNAVLSCEQCEFCLAGAQSLCRRLRLIGEHGPGTIAEFFVAPAENFEKIPEGITFVEAAAFSLVFQTAWRMLINRGRIRAGEDVFIHGIGGGVATAALQIALFAGCRVFVSSSSEDKLAQARAMGAEFTYNYQTQEVADAVLRDTGKRGVDVVVDCVGAATWLQSLKMAAKDGRVLTCGATTGANPSTEIRLIFWKQLQIIGSTMSNRSEYQTLINLLAQRRLRPQIHRVFPFAEAVEAIRALKSGSHFGKLVIEFPE